MTRITRKSWKKDHIVLVKEMSYEDVETGRLLTSGRSSNWLNLIMIGLLVGLVGLLLIVQLGKSNTETGDYTVGPTAMAKRLTRFPERATVRKIITSPNIKSYPGLTFSQGVQVGKTLYISANFGTGKEGILATGIKAQTRQALDNVGHILHAAGASFENVVQVTVLLADIKDYLDMNTVFGEYFTARFPARVAFQVAALPLPNALVAIEAVAITGKIWDE